MFKKNDPLVEVSKKIMQENETRRQVVLLVNESLGIEDKKVLPRELFAEYDTILAEAQSVALKEGIDRVQLDESLLATPLALLGGAAVATAAGRMISNKLRKNKVDKQNRERQERFAREDAALKKENPKLKEEVESLDEEFKHVKVAKKGDVEKAYRLDRGDRRIDIRKHKDGSWVADSNFGHTESDGNDYHSSEKDVKRVSTPARRAIKSVMKGARDQRDAIKDELDESVRTPLPKVYKKKAIKEDTSIEALDEMLGKGEKNLKSLNKPTIKGWANAQKRVNAAVNEEQLDELSRKTLKSYVGKAKKSLDTLNSKADKYSDIADRYSDRMYNATKSKTRKEYERKSDAANSKVIGFENKASIRDAGVKQARDRLRGTYTSKHKYKLKEDTSIEAINEEIYDNLLANLIEAYQSSEDAFNDMVDSLTEEQLQILGFTEGIQ